MLPSSRCGKLIWKALVAKSREKLAAKVLKKGLTSNELFWLNFLVYTKIPCQLF